MVRVITFGLDFWGCMSDQSPSTVVEEPKETASLETTISNEAEFLKISKEPYYTKNSSGREVQASLEFKKKDSPSSIVTSVSEAMFKPLAVSPKKQLFFKTLHEKIAPEFPDYNEYTEAGLTI